MKNDQCIGTEFLAGQGLGNRLFCYVSTRCIAKDSGFTFATAGREQLRADFLQLDMGVDAGDPADWDRYDEAQERLYLKTSAHDMVHGCFVAGADPKLASHAVGGGTLLYGNLQDPSYFASHRDEIKEWLRVKDEFESDEYTADNLCILNMRGSEYADDPALFLRKKYWLDAMAQMKKVRADMRFMIVTEDVESANKLLPGIPAYHFSPEKDYVTVKNARYLILSNSSFGFFPAFTSDTVQKVIAPKYWARHNVSNGYWASAQNIYDGFLYLDRHGKLFDADTCRRELEAYVMPKTTAWSADDPAVARVKKQCETKRLAQKALHKLQRIILGR